MWEKIKHAFAVNGTGAEPTPQQLELVDRLCGVIKQRGLTPAAIAFLEMARPMSYVGAQGMHFLEPIATTIFSPSQYRDLSLFLERRDAVDIICERLETLESGKDGEDTLVYHQQLEMGLVNRNSATTEHGPCDLPPETEA